MKKSVAMATYNGEKFLTEQLDSIRNQTTAVDEVRICDDKSKDNTVQLIRDYIEKYNLAPAWSVEVNEENLGYASNFMKALSLTSGDLIFFCDQDDIWVEDRVEKMEQIMEQNPKIMLLGSEFEPFSDSEDALDIPSWEKKMMKHDGSLEKMDFIPENIFIGCQGCTMVMRRELITASIDYWYKGWAHDEYVWKTALCMEGLYMYHADTLKRRCHASNASLNKMHKLDSRLKYVTDLLASHEATLKFAKMTEVSEKNIKLLEKNIEATKLRIELLKNKKVFYTIPLFFKYRDCYHKKRAILTELVMGLK